MTEGVLVGGELRDLRHPITGYPIPIFGPDDHGMEFEPGDGHNTHRVQDIDLGIFHWTGSENSLETMFRTLNKRGLGVFSAISPYGSLYTFADPLVVKGAHAGKVNPRAWGCEMVNAGIRRMSTLWREPRYRKVKMGAREKYDCRIHGRKVRIWDFYPAQKMTMFALNRLMVDAIDSYPAEVNTAPVVLPLTGDDRVTGAAAHYNVNRRKLDCGPLPMAQLDHFMKTGDAAAALDVTLAL